MQLHGGLLPPTLVLLVLLLLHCQHASGLRQQQEPLQWLHLVRVLLLGALLALNAVRAVSTGSRVPWPAVSVAAGLSCTWGTRHPP